MAGAAIPAPYAITADDKRGLLVVTGAAVLAFVWCCFLIRLWLRFQTREWRADDWLLAIATALDTAQSGVIFHLVDLGLGASQASLTRAQLEQVGKAGFASQLLYILVLLASKLSVLFLYLRLSPGGAHRLATWSTTIVSLAWALLAIVLIAVPCNPIQALDHPDTCTNRWPKWQAIGALDIVTELAIVAIATQLVWTLQMRLKTKLLVILAFSARLPVIAIAGVRLYYLYQRLAGDSYTFEYVVATQWQMGYAIMSSTITGMGPFLRPFNQEYATSYKYGVSSQKSTPQDPSLTGASVLRPTVSQSYLMEALPSRRASTKTGSDAEAPHRASATTSLTSDPAHGSPSSQAPIVLIADDHFRPVDSYTRHEAEVWVGDGAASMGQDQPRSALSRDGLVVNKRTEFKIQVDRASRVV
ncbi:hypothetical protein ACN47E_001255 [Coniothyrium glycines]